MRLPLVILALAIAAPAACAADRAPGSRLPHSGGPVIMVPDRIPGAKMPVYGAEPSSEDCPPISRYHAMQRDKRLKAKRLSELPMADAYNAVYRRIGKCQAPIIVRYGIGGEQR